MSLRRYISAFRNYYTFKTIVQNIVHAVLMRKIKFPTGTKVYQNNSIAKLINNEKAQDPTLTKNMSFTCNCKKICSRKRLLRSDISYYFHTKRRRNSTSVPKCNFSSLFYCQGDFHLLEGGGSGK